MPAVSDTLLPVPRVKAPSAISSQEAEPEAPSELLSGESEPAQLPSEPDASPQPDAEPEHEPDPLVTPDEPEEEPQLEADDRCPLCDGTGHLAVLPNADPLAHRCPDCDGHGMVYTGSRIPESSLRTCGRCEGKGFVEPPNVVNGVPISPTLPQGETSAEYFDKNDPATWHLPTRPSAWDAQSA